MTAFQKPLRYGAQNHTHVQTLGWKPFSYKPEMLLPSLELMQ